jgi:hypothetical protein
MRSGETAVLGADGESVLTVAAWVRREAAKTESGKQQAEIWMGEAEEVLPMRNPFRRKTWNVTGQMRMTRRDPRQARRFKAEAVANGEN